MGLYERIYGKAQADRTADPGLTIGEAIAAAREVWGRPGRCPSCGGRGYLDRIDVIDRIMYEHCTECFHKWQVAEADTVPAT
jgi:uncharacterized protein (DUF983 family)